MEPAGKATQFLKSSFYYAVRGISRLLAILLLDYRIHGQERMPSEGAVMILSNHQSLLDPVLVGILFDRKLEYLAKKSLFKNPYFGFLIRALDAIPIDRERGGLEGLKMMMQRMKDGRAMLIFPEGTRSRDGELLPIKGGFIAVARRSNATLLPVAIAGAHEVMRLGSFLPSRQSVAATVGEPILPESYKHISDDQLILLVSGAIRGCWEDANRLRAGKR